jgi:hypothetical protein
LRHPLSAELLRPESTDPNFQKPETSMAALHRIPLAMEPHFIITHPMM